MKKLGLTLICFVLAFSSTFASAKPAKPAKIEDKVQYVILDKLPSASPEVIQFFSFYCGTCMLYEELGVINQINAGLPKNIKVKKYHVDFMQGISTELSKAWAIAKVLGVEDKVEPILFERIQKSKNLRTAEQIRDVFVQIGIPAEQYDSMEDNFLVKGIILQQKKAVEEFKVTFVPSIFVNGKYLVRQGGLDGSTTESFTADYARVINFLLKKK